MPTELATAGLVIGAGGLTALLTAFGLRSLGAQPRAPLLTAAGVLGALATTAVIVPTGLDWLDIPMAPWAAAMTALAVCDHQAQRIPTGIARTATAAMIALLVGSSLAGDEWRPLAFALIASGSGSALGWLLQQHAGLGAGDIRLLALGGLGLGASDSLSLLAGFVAFTLVVSAYSTAARRRGGTRRTAFPYGPAFAAGFLVAAAI